MTQIIVVTLFFIIAFTLMALALNFAKYKKGDSGCCGGGNCETGGGSCYNSKVNYIDNEVIKPNAK